jgi:hypothetical protein
MPVHHPRDFVGVDQCERPKSRHVGHVQVQHLRVQLVDGTLERSPEPQRDGGVDQVELDRHAAQPGRVIGQGVAMNDGMAVNTL